MSVSYDYDNFEFGNTNIAATAVPLGKDNSGTLTVPPLYRLKTRTLDISNVGSVSGVLTLQKKNGTNTITILYETVAAGGVLNFDEKHPFIVETGYYLVASITAGQAAIFGQGDFVPE